MKLYYFFKIELCCSYCYFLNMHKNHKLIPINDEESLRKENIKIEDSIGEFNECFEKINKLKDKTENEMIKLDELYNKTDKDLAQSFEEKHLILTKQENEMREKLQNQVTKIKEKLELYITNLNELIRSCEKINKGIKVLQKEDKQMIKKLSYISKINKNKKEMVNLFKEPMKNLKINFIKEENNIKYTEYYFNGSEYNLKSIEFSDISFNKFKITWKVEDFLKLNLNNQNKNVIFRVEMRKENKNKNELFKVVYEGKESNCSIYNLEPETTYEIKINIIIENIIIDESILKKISTKAIDSLILKETHKEKEFLKKIFEFINIKNIELIYRGTRDGMNSNSFHNKCDNKGPTLCLYKNDKGHIFGAYAAISWTNKGEWKSAPQSFLFTLTNIYNIAPTKMTHNLKDTIYSVYHNADFGPSFGSGRDISIPNDFVMNESYANFPYTYNDATEKGPSIFSSDLKSNRFKLTEIEVYKIS